LKPVGELKLEGVRRTRRAENTSELTIPVNLSSYSEKLCILCEEVGETLAVVKPVKMRVLIMILWFRVVLNKIMMEYR
jgi:hypothetical protein